VDTTIHTVDNLESVDQRLSRGPFTHISASPNGKSLALLTFNGTLWVVSSDFQRSMAEFNTANVPAATGPVRQIEWCGNDAILATWDSLAILVGPFGDTLQFVDTICLQKQELTIICNQIFLHRRYHRYHGDGWCTYYWTRNLRLHPESSWYVSLLAVPYSF
jgi:hypothetical protein